MTQPTPHPLFRRALRQQRQLWRRQHGRPPIPLSRQNHPWQPWEVAWLQTPSLPSLPILSIWLGRPPAEIQEQLLAILEELAVPEKKTKNKDSNPMTPIIAPSDQTESIDELIQIERTVDALIQVYHDQYIGQSTGLSSVAEKHNISPIALKELWIQNGLRLRNRSQAYAARKQSGTPWRWPDQSKDPPHQPVQDNPPTNGHLQLTEGDITRIYNDLYIGQSIGLSECATYLGVNYIVLKEHCHALGLRLRDRSETAIARTRRGQPWTWDYITKETPEDPTGHPTLPSNITALIRELKAAGAEVQVHITLQLEIPK